MVLHTAILADVDIMITGDKDFKYIEIERPEILTPRSFLKSIKFINYANYADVDIKCHECKKAFEVKLEKMAEKKLFWHRDTKGANNSPIELSR